MGHVCRIAVSVHGEQRVADNPNDQPPFGDTGECGKPAARCIVCSDPSDPEGPVTIWLCEEHFNDPNVRAFFELVWDRVDY